MNEWQFKRHLNEKANQDGIYTYMHLLHLLDKNMSSSLTKEGSTLIRKEKNACKIVQKNLELILKKTPPGHIKNIIELLFDNSETMQIVKNNIDLFLDKLIEVGEKHPAKLLYKSSYIIMKIRKHFGKEFIDIHIDKLLKSIPIRNLAYEMNSLQGISTHVDEKLNEYIQSDLKGFVRGIIDTAKIPEISGKEKLIDMYEATVLELLKEIIPRKTIIEGKKTTEIELWNEIEKIGEESTYSDVYIIGNRVMKIGDVRATYRIPNHSRILQPIARFEMYLDDDNNVPIGCIEISNKVRKLERKDYSEEKFYKLYEDLRKAGIVFTDCRTSNIGVLCSENTPVHRVNGQIIKVSPESVGFIGEMKGKKCKEGDLVVLDTDFLFREEDLFKDGIFKDELLDEEEWQEKSYSKEFERRWQQEKQAEIAMKYLEQKETKAKVDRTLNGKGDK